jgi:outer membrane protein OmpA-like peptidoglycan-associated protein
MNRRLSIVVPLLVAVALCACKRKDQEAAPAAASQEQTAPAASQEQAAPPAPAAAAPAPAPAAATFDLASVPVTSKELPAFPYLSTPSGVEKANISERVDLDFDRTHVVAGEDLRQVEGRIYERYFYLSDLKWSPLAAHRNYENALKAMGATRVDKMNPMSEAFIARHGGDQDAIQKKLDVRSFAPSDDPDVPNFEQWLIRTPTTNIWLSFHLASNAIYLRTVEEKALEQKVSVVPAEKLSRVLKADGHVALYLNFDHDSAAIRPDSLPAVGEVAKLMRSEPGLKLKVEGHTDNVGTPEHNRKLSLARAQSVVKAIVDQSIAPSRLTPAGLGSDRPLADNGSEEGRAKNRRVELVRV